MNPQMHVPRHSVIPGNIVATILGRRYTNSKYGGFEHQLTPQPQLYTHNEGSKQIYCWSKYCPLADSKAFQLLAGKGSLCKQGTNPSFFSQDINATAMTLICLLIFFLYKAGNEVSTETLDE